MTHHPIFQNQNFYLSLYYLFNCLFSQYWDKKKLAVIKTTTRLIDPIITTQTRLY